MQPLVILRIIGLLLMIFSTTVIPPVLVSLWYQDTETVAFINAFLVILFSGFIIWLPVRNKHQELRIRDGFIVVVLFWFVFGLVGSLPLYLSQSLDANFTDSLFESISALTTTGATVFIGLDDLPRSILYYRQQLQWLGGMGIVVLAVAVLPMLGIGGMQLYRAETPGPIKDNKLTPRITETAKALWDIFHSWFVSFIWVVVMGVVAGNIITGRLLAGKTSNS